MDKIDALDDIEEFIEEFSSYLKIDQNDLDNEIIQFPELYWKVCHRYKLLISIRDEYKDSVKQTDGMLYLRWKEHYEDIGEKATEAKIQASVETDDEHKDIVAAYRTASTVADLLESLKAAFEQRSYGLKELTDLYITNYSSQTVVERPRQNIKEAVAEEIKGKVQRRPLRRTT